MKLIIGSTLRIFLEKDTTNDRYIMRSGDEIRYKVDQDDSWKKAVVKRDAGTVK